MKIELKGATVTVDDDLQPELLALNWRIDRRGYVRTTINGRKRGQTKTLMLHRAVVAAGPNQIVDHVDRDKLNCRRANLRLVTPQLNAINRGKRSTSASRFKGVSKHRNGWQVYIGSKYVGLRRDEVEAARLYDSAAAAAYGEQAVTNASLGLL